MTDCGGGLYVVGSLSSPFMDASSACGFFDIILGLFIQANTTSVGKLIGRRRHHFLRHVCDDRCS